MEGILAVIPEGGEESEVLDDKLPDLDDEAQDLNDILGYRPQEYTQLTSTMASKAADSDGKKSQEEEKEKSDADIVTKVNEAKQRLIDSFKQLMERVHDNLSTENPKLSLEILQNESLGLSRTLQKMIQTLKLTVHVEGAPDPS